MDKPCQKAYEAMEIRKAELEIEADRTEMIKNGICPDCGAELRIIFRRTDDLCDPMVYDRVCHKHGVVDTFGRD